MWLILAHPKVATRDCSHCLSWQYDESTGLVALWPNGEPQKRITPAPCRFKEKLLREGARPDSPAMRQAGCPKGTPEDDRGLNAENCDAYGHYLQCKAVGQFPRDAIVMRNAGIIRQAEDDFQRMREREVVEVVTLLASRAMAGV